MCDDAEQWKQLWRQNLETAQQAIRERDDALLKLAVVQEIAEANAAVGWRDVPSQTCDEAEGRNIVSEQILRIINPT